MSEPTTEVEVDEVAELVNESAVQSPAEPESNDEDTYTIDDLVGELPEEEQIMLLGFKRRAEAAFEAYKEAAAVVQRSRDVGKSVSDKWTEPGDDAELSALRQKYDALLAEADEIEKQAKRSLTERLSQDIDQEAVKNAENVLKVQKQKYDAAMTYANEEVLEPNGVDDHTLQEFVPALPLVSSASASAGGREGKKPRIGKAYVDGNEITMNVTKDGVKSETSNFTALRLWLTKETGKKVETSELQNAWLAEAHVDNFEKIDFPVEFTWPKKDGGNYMVTITPQAKK